MKTNYTIQFTGLSGAGKTTLSKAIHKYLSSNGDSIELLDGDEYRDMQKDKLTFSKEHRDININSVGILTYYLNKNSINVINATISPYKSIRDWNRQLIEKDGCNFFHIHCTCDIETLRERDTKGLYKLNDITLTGVNDPYEIPDNADMYIDTSVHSQDACVLNILLELRRQNIVPNSGTFLI